MDWSPYDLQCLRTSKRTGFSSETARISQHKELLYSIRWRQEVVHRDREAPALRRHKGASPHRGDERQAQQYDEEHRGFMSDLKFNLKLSSWRQHEEMQTTTPPCSWVKPDPLPEQRNRTFAGFMWDHWGNELVVYPISKYYKYNLIANESTYWKWQKKEAFATRTFTSRRQKRSSAAIPHIPKPRKSVPYYIVKCANCSPDASFNGKASQKDPISSVPTPVTQVEGYLKEPDQINVETCMQATRPAEGKYWMPQ